MAKERLYVDTNSALCDRLNFGCSEEIAEEAQTRMTAIQNREMDHLKELTNFLDLEVEFARSYLDILTGLKDEWIDP